MSATQRLQQQVCQKYGWSYEYGTEDDDDGHWFVEIVVGFGDKRRFVSPSKQGKKEGRDTVSLMALEGLEDAIAIEDAKSVKELTEVFPNPIQIYDSSNPATWEMFWKDPPTVVGIDAEGNLKSPPVLAQISTDDYTILEVGRDAISSNLKRLLKDESITKVFCDNFAHKDKKCLGLDIGNDTADFSKPPIVDIEVLAANLLAPTKTPRGLSKIVSLCMPELNVRISKPPRNPKGGGKGRFANIGRFALIEQGKARPLRGLHDLKSKEQQYAALDSWCTLLAYRRLMEEMERRGP